MEPAKNTEPEPGPVSLETVLDLDPFKHLAPGEALTMSCEGALVLVDNAQPSGIFPLQANEGMIMAVTFRTEDGDHTAGSAVLVAPGVALCASHVIEHFMDRMRVGRCQPLLSGPATHGINLWLPEIVAPIPRTDLTILCMRFASKLPPANRFVVANLTTRTPELGESVVLCGLPAQEMTATPIGGNSSVNIKPTYTSGTVLDLHIHGRDSHNMPGPCFAVSCNAYGGMSGGPVFDRRGYLIGLVSTSIEGEPPVAYVSQIWPAITLPLPPRSPLGPRLPEPSLLGLHAHHGLVKIERPEALTLNADERFGARYAPWS